MTRQSGFLQENIFLLPNNIVLANLINTLNVLKDVKMQK
jgi:hypothetical protein